MPPDYPPRPRRPHSDSRSGSRRGAAAPRPLVRQGRSEDSPYNGTLHGDEGATLHIFASLAPACSRSPNATKPFPLVD